MRDYINVSYVVDAILKCIHYVGDSFAVNISSGVGTSLNNLIAYIEAVLGRKLTVHYLSPRTFDIPVNVLSNNLASHILEWSPKSDLKNDIAELIKFHGLKCRE